MTESEFYKEIYESDSVRRWRIFKDGHHYLEILHEGKIHLLKDEFVKELEESKPFPQVGDKVRHKGLKGVEATVLEIGLIKHHEPAARVFYEDDGEITVMVQYLSLVKE